VSRQFTILNPCSRHWDELPGTGRARYCDTCQTLVHDFREYSPEEWDQVRSQSNGRVCGYMAADISPVQPSRRALLAGALLTAVSPLIAQSGRVRIRVTDATGSVLPSAEATRLGTDDKPMDYMRANERGEVVWTGLPMGVCQFAVWSPGFNTYRISVIIKNADEIQAYAQLELGTLGSFVEIVNKKRQRWWIFW